MTMCEDCANHVFDEEEDCFYCDIDLDEDELLKFLMSNDENCPYYRSGDEYEIVRKQN